MERSSNHPWIGLCKLFSLFYCFHLFLEKSYLIRWHSACHSPSSAKSFHVQRVPSNSFVHTHGTDMAPLTLCSSDCSYSGTNSDSVFFWIVFQNSLAIHMLNHLTRVCPEALPLSLSYTNTWVMGMFHGNPESLKCVSYILGVWRLLWSSPKNLHLKWVLPLLPLFPSLHIPPTLCDPTPLLLYMGSNPGHILTGLL